MKNVYRILMAALLMSFTHFTYATQAPGELQANTISDTSVVIDWQEVPDVLGYYIYYGETSGSGSDYDIEGVDLIEDSTYELTDLNPETRYYIAMTAVDETGSESEKSPELEIQTLAPGSQAQAVSLRIIDAQVIDDTSIEMEFSLDMESGSSAGRQFIIENLDSGEELGVDISDTIPGDPRKILAILDGNLQPNSQYKVTVLDIRDVDGNTIESGIDAFVNFMTPEVFTTELESAGVSEEETQEPDTNMQNEEIQVEENNQGEVEENNVEMVDENTMTEDSQPLGNNAGTTISTDDLSGNTLNAAAENDKLPQTGPEHWILLLVAVMLGTGLFYRFKK